MAHRRIAMGTPLSVMGTNMGTHFAGIPWNMQAYVGTKTLCLRGLS